MLEMEKIIISNIIAEAQRKIKAKLAVDVFWVLRWAFIGVVVYFLNA
jgi:hypothetical protein